METQEMTLQHEPLKNGQHARWIAGRVQVLLSHYFQPDNPQDVQEAALGDWIEALAEFDQSAIDRACAAYIRSQPRRRPTPGDIRKQVMAPKSEAQGRSRDELSVEELILLDEKILPSARKWLTIPGLADKGRATLAYWGEVA